MRAGESFRKNGSSVPVRAKFRVGVVSLVVPPEGTLPVVGATLSFTPLMVTVAGAVYVWASSTDRARGFSTSTDTP